MLPNVDGYTGPPQIHTLLLPLLIIFSFLGWLLRIPITFTVCLATRYSDNVLLRNHTLTLACTTCNHRFLGQDNKINCSNDNKKPLQAVLMLC
jgi:hypothetical protein